MLHDDTGRTICCGIEHELTVSEVSYLLCYPVDAPVAFARAAVPDGESLSTIDDAALNDRLFPAAEAALAEEHAVLRKTALLFTVEEWGELADDNEEEEEEDSGSDDEVQVMAEFSFEGEEFLVLQPLYPMLFIAKPSGDRHVAVDGAELDAVAPAFEAFIETL